MIKESSGAATKNTRSVDERHEVYEEQRGATKELQGSYEYNENSVSSWRLAALHCFKKSLLQKLGVSLLSLWICLIYSS